jgi:hypothetical protein
VNLADLIDLEAQLARDREGSPDALQARDRALLADAPPPGERADLLAAWLEALRAAEPGQLFPGGAVVRTLRLVRLALAALGLAMGWGASAALFAFTGGHPVDVWSVLLALVLVQVLLVGFLVVALVVPGATEGAPFVGLLREVAGKVVRGLAARGWPARTEAWRSLWHRLRARRSLYRRVEPWLLLATTQGFGVAFNVGALLALLRAVTFSDVAFAWSTTLVDLGPARLHALVSLLASPFGWLCPDAVPSLALVEATHYSRLEGAYVSAGAGRAADPALVGGWWPFLAACICCYGLLPRAAALAFARLRTRGLLRTLPLDDAEVLRVTRRLAEPHLDTRSPSPEAGAPAVPPVSSRTAPRRAGSRAALVLWRDVPGGDALRAAVARQVGCEVAVVRTVGGRDDPDGLGPEALDGADAVVVVAEGFEAPDRAALRMVRSLRAVAGPRREIRVLLVDVEEAQVRGASDADVDIWSEALARLEDAHLLAEPLAEAAR